MVNPFNSGDFLSPLFKMFGKVLTPTPPNPANLDIIQFNATTQKWQLVSGVIGTAVQSSSNVGTGAGLALPRVLDDLPFKSILAGSGISIVVTPTTIEIINTQIAKNKLHLDIYARDDPRNFANMPLAITELFNRTSLRTLADLDAFTQARLSVNIDTIGFAGAVLFAEYDIGAGFVELADIANAGNVSIDSIPADFVNDSGFFDIDSPAIDPDVLIRIVGQGGNGVVDPKLGHISLEFR